MKELKDFEVGPPAMQGSLKVEYIKKPVPTIATRQGSKVIGTIPGKRKETVTTISWDAFHEHKTERTSTEEIVELGDLCPAVNGHMLVPPECFTLEFDMYLFTPASGPRKNDGEDWCKVNFCGHTFCINTWSRDIYNMYFIGGDSLENLEATKPGWHHFSFLFIGPENDKVVLNIDGETMGTKTGGTPYPKKDTDNCISFHSGTSQQYFCVKNVKVTGNK